MPPVKSCIICGKPFETPYPHCVTCSKECRMEHCRRRAASKWKQYMATREPVIFMATCPQCGNEFAREHGRTKYCSKDCYREASKKNMVKVRARQNEDRKKRRVCNVVTLRPCPLCGELRESAWPGDRYHANCRETVGRRSSAFN